MTSEPDPHLRLTRREETVQQPGQAILGGTEKGVAEDTVEAGFYRRARRGSVLARLSVLLLSAGGVIVAAWLWHTGHGPLGLRVMAGDVLVLTLIVLLL